MNKNLLVGLGVFLAVVVVGIFLIGRPKTSSPRAKNTPSILPSAPLKEFNISGKEYGFTPSTISVNKGDNVKINFTNNGTTSHNLTISDLNIATNTISPGQTDSITFNAATSGLFNFSCSVDGHRGLGMQGTLEVK